MIQSASPQSRPVVIFAWFWSFVMDRRTTCVKIVITTGHDCGRPIGSKTQKMRSQKLYIKCRDIPQEKTFKYKVCIVILVFEMYYPSLLGMKIHVVGSTLVGVLSKIWLFKEDKRKNLMQCFFFFLQHLYSNLSHAFFQRSNKFFIFICIKYNMAYLV